MQEHTNISQLLFSLSLTHTIGLSLPPFQFFILSATNPLRCDSKGLNSSLFQISWPVWQSPEPSTHSITSKKKWRGKKDNKVIAMKSKGWKRWVQRAETPHLVKEGGNKVCSSLSDGGVKGTGISAHEKLLNASVLWQCVMPGAASLPWDSASRFTTSPPTQPHHHFSQTGFPQKYGEWIKHNK